jgi:sugar lactone lactonase YvrE
MNDTLWATAFACLMLLVTAGKAHSVSQSGKEDNGRFELLHEWDILKFATKGGAEPCDKAMLAGVKVSSNGRFFVSAPRWKLGVPATLSEVNFTSGVLTPFPSLIRNAVGMRGALQSVLGFEIDAQDRLWALDQGKVAGKAAIPGAIKLLIWDLKTDTQVQLHEFPPDVASPTASFLNDLVVDQVNNVAYVTDSGIGIDGDAPLQPGLIVFDFSTNSSRRVLSNHSSVMNTDLWLVVNGSKVLETRPMRTGADGIALTPDTKTLYYCPLTSHTLYRLPTALLRDPNLPADKLARAVVNVTGKDASDGLGMGNNNVLFLTSLEQNGIRQLNVAHPSHAETRPLVSDPRMVWPDTIGFDQFRSAFLFCFCSCVLGTCPIADPHLCVTKQRPQSRLDCVCGTRERRRVLFSPRDPLTLFSLGPRPTTLQRIGRTPWTSAFPISKYGARSSERTAIFSLVIDVPIECQFKHHLISERLAESTTRQRVRRTSEAGSTGAKGQIHPIAQQERPPALAPSSQSPSRTTQVPRSARRSPDRNSP